MALGRFVCPVSLSKRILSDIQLDMLPTVSDRVPFVYIDKARLEVDDASVKVLCSSGRVTNLPIATLLSIWLGPGTSITHEAIKALAKTNCNVCWVGEDGLIFHAAGQKPTSKTDNYILQAELASVEEARERVARKMFKMRFKDMDVSMLSIPSMMGMEGNRVRKLYQDLAAEIGLLWTGRRSGTTDWEGDDLVNKLITVFNSALYSLCSCVIHSLGYSPRMGFVHRGSPLPFVYDIADLYKEELSIRPAFEYRSLGREYNRDLVSSTFRANCQKSKLMERLPKDIKALIARALL